MLEKQNAPLGIAEILPPRNERAIRRSADPEASSDEVDAAKESCVDHLCGCKS
jgi:hypothetical protein